MGKIARAMIVGCICLLSIGCKERDEATPTTKYAAGQIVHCKAGGPKGIVRYTSIDINGRECEMVRFFRDENNSVKIGVGGSGVISGGDGIKDRPFYDEEFFAYELEEVR
jgi:uncharacterized protein YodC (DUF2158 family)